MSKRTLDDFFNVANKKKNSTKLFEGSSSSGLISTSTNRCVGDFDKSFLHDGESGLDLDEQEEEEEENIDINSNDSNDENVDEPETNTRMFADCTYQNNSNMQNSSTMSKIPGPIDIAQMLDEGPTQPTLKSYPKTIYGVGKTKRMRSFNSSWYNQFNWIEYSKIDDSVNCFFCRFFSFKTNSDLSFINVGYKNWKNAMSCKGFIRHHNTDEYKKMFNSLVKL